MRCWINRFEKPLSKLGGVFCRTAVLRCDGKKFCLILIRSYAPQQTAGNTSAVAVQWGLLQLRALDPVSSAFLGFVEIFIHLIQHVINRQIFYEHIR